MLLRTCDGTFKHEWVMVLQETLRFTQTMNINEYSMGIHREKDTIIENWLAGAIHLFNTETEAKEFTNKQETGKYVI